MTARTLNLARQQTSNILEACADAISRVLQLRGDPVAHAFRLGLAAFVLGVVGIIVQASVVHANSPDPTARFLRQGIFLCVGVAIALTVGWIGYRRSAALARYGLWLTWGPLLWLALSERGSRAARWIELPGFSVQPSEIAKLLLILFLAGFAVEKGKDLKDLRKGFLPAAGYLGITALLVAAAPDFGQTAFIVATSSALLIVGGISFRQLAVAVLATLPILIAYMSQRWSYIGERVTGFLDGGAEQVNTGIAFLERGGVLGVGLGEVRAHRFVSEVHNDFALVVVGEQFGVVGSLAVVALFIAIVWHGFAIAFAARDTLGFLVAFGVTLMVGLQAAVNLAVVTGSVPPKGMALPFVSYGGSSMVVCGAAIGLILSVARTTARAQRREEQIEKSPRSQTA